MTGASARSDQGFVAIWLLVAAMIVLVIGGLTLDLWGALAARTTLTAIADDAAAAGAGALDVDRFRRDGEVALDPAAAQEAAAATLRAHPDAARITDAAVGATPAGVTVRLRGPYDLTLLRLVGATSVDIVVTGAAAPVLQR